MALGIRTPGLKLVWEADGLEIDLLPLQGLWTEEQYLRLTDQTNRLIEFTEGSVEILPLPTRKHQAISRYLFLALLAFVERIGGTVFYAPLRVRVAPNRFREPDLYHFCGILMQNKVGSASKNLCISHYPRLPKTLRPLKITYVASATPS